MQTHFSHTTALWLALGGLGFSGPLGWPDHKPAKLGLTPPSAVSPLLTEPAEKSLPEILLAPEESRPWLKRTFKNSA